MSLVINTNVSSLTAQNNLTKSQNALSQATERLSSGLKINSAKDNAAGFAISQRYTTQIGGLNQASANASDAINLAQTAGSALDQVTANLQAIRDLAVQSANGTYGDDDRKSIDQEVQQRLAEITRIANQTTFNGSKVLDGSMNTKSFQIGADVGQTISVNLGTSVKASDIGSIATVSTGDISGLFGNQDGTAGDPFTGTVGTIDWTDADTVSGLGEQTYDGQTVDWADATGVTDADSAVAWLAGQLGDGYTVVEDGDTAGQLNITGPAADGTAASSGLKLAAGDLNIDGVDIKGTFNSVQDLADAINVASYDNASVSAAVSADGKSLNFYSSTALTIYGAAAANDSDADNSLKFTNANIGADADSSTAIAVEGNLSTGNVSTVDDANALISRVDVALKSVSDFAAQLGAVQNRFQSTISTLAAQTTNLQSSQSTIQDADFAAETAALSKAQVLQQAGISVLAQANSNPQQVLKLLQ